VTKRFFAEGEKRIGGSDAGNYFYSRDHLGSIREVTDSTGALNEGGITVYIGRPPSMAPARPPVLVYRPK